MAKDKIKNSKSAEAFRKDIVKFLATHNISLAALARISQTSQPSLQSEMTLKIAFNPTMARVEKLRDAMKKIHDHPKNDW